MKIKKCKTLLLTLIAFCFLQNLYSQSLCLDRPPTEAEVVVCNVNIAHAFAPEINQLTWGTPSGSGFPLNVYPADIPTTVNYDGNWNGIDNWENLGDYPLNPSIYYAVWWLDNYWLIRYYVYYPRDWASDVSVLCIFDEHEHDIEVITIMVRRPANQTEADDPSLLSYGTSVSHHGGREYASCPPASTNGSPDIPYPQGIHPIIYSAIGSHGMYYTEADADKDDFPNPCRPDHFFIVTYFPSSASPQPVLNCETGSCSQPYTLIDMFNPTMGLWAQRDNEDLWDGDKFECNTIVCKAGKPWLGNGKNPACDFMNNLDRMCNDDTGENLPPDQNRCNKYVYNGYCDTPKTEFILNEIYCCGPTVSLDGTGIEGEDRYKVKITDLDNNGMVNTGWIEEHPNEVNLSEIWTEETGGRFQSGNTYEVCLTPANCTWGDEVCKEFTLVQPTFDFDLLDAGGNIIPDGGTIEAGSRPSLDPTELSCIGIYHIKVCEELINDGDFRGPNCNWYYDGIGQYGDDPVDVVDAVSTGWPNTFSFQEGYKYQICMYSESTCTVPLCKSIEIEGLSDMICVDTKSPDSPSPFPFCYEVIPICDPGGYCDPCYGGAICVYNEEGGALDLSDYLFSIDMGNYTLSSESACFSFSSEQAISILGFYLYNVALQALHYVPLDLCDTGMEGGLIGKEDTDVYYRAGKESGESERTFDVKVYPNPTEGIVFLSTSGLESGLVIVSDLLGKEIFRGSLENTSKVDFAEWPTGIYLISILDENFNPVHTQKIVKR